MKLCPMIKDRNVYIFCGPSGLAIPKLSTNAPARKADIIDEITTNIPVRILKVLFIFLDIKLFVFLRYLVSNLTNGFIKNYRFPLKKFINIEPATDTFSDSPYPVFFIEMVVSKIFKISSRKP